MKVKKLCCALAMAGLLALQLATPGRTQEAAFELPVQLVGFPFIILAVRLTNFVKKLSYSLSPATYRSRSRRALDAAVDVLEVEKHVFRELGARACLYTTYRSRSRRALDAAVDVLEVEKHVVRELGARACLYDRVCTHYAQRVRAHATNEQLDWDNVFSQYKRSPEQTKEFYLLSVFLGNIVGSPSLCHQLAKRRPCEPLSYQLADTPH